MQTFNNFSELLEANTVSVPVSNWYGDNAGILFPDGTRLSTRIVTQDLYPYLGDNGVREHATWEHLKSERFVKLPIVIGRKDKNDSDFADILGEVDILTGALFTEGSLVGILSKPLVDVVLSALDNNEKDLVKAMERAIWEFVDKHPNKFNWRYKNE